MPVCSIVRLLPPTASCNNESPQANSFAYTTNRHELTVYHITEYGPRLEKTYEQQWGRPLCASAQSDQHLCYSLIGKYNIWNCYERNTNFLANLYS